MYKQPKHKLHLPFIPLNSLLLQDSLILLTNHCDLGFNECSSDTPKQTVPLKKRLKAVLAVENWVGTACVLEIARGGCEMPVVV